MAEPLLKRTFSRLRVKEKFRKKAESKLPDVQSKTDLTQGTSSSVFTESKSGLAEDFSRRTQITVAKKQNWARLASSSQEATRLDASHLVIQKVESSLEKPKAPNLASNQRTLCIDSAEIRCQDFDWEPAPSSPLWESLDIVLPELAPCSGAGYDEMRASSSAPSSSTVRLAGQGAYLQNLEKSSRAWVLSTGKNQVSGEEALRQMPSGLIESRQSPEGENNIWYNPIPEEEDSHTEDGRNEFGDPWRRRGEENVNSRKVQEKSFPQEGEGSGTWPFQGAEGGALGSSIRDVSTEVTVGCNSSSSSRKGSPDLSQQRAQGCEVKAGPRTGGVGGSCSSSTSLGGGCATSASSDSPTLVSKKSSGSAGAMSGSVMERIRSPGTVRRLSMKMCKLPELRRKLSLRSSRSQRHRGRGDGSEEASPPESRKESSNVISRYHLDSSAPRTQSHRRASRSRSVNKCGYLSDGDSPELPPKQGSSSSATASAFACQDSVSPDLPSNPQGQDIAAGSGGLVPIADMAAFRQYNFAEQPRCAQRISGLLTLHLLGLDELTRPTTRTDITKEVFCAIQVDGVTRGRTAPLICRGTSLALNHTFNLELEQARLLKLVLLTPVVTTDATSRGQQQVASRATAPARNRVCCMGAVAIPPLFRGSRCQQLCVSLEPRGLLYVKLTLLEQWESPPPRLSQLPPPAVFSVELRHLVEKEDSGLQVPLLIQKCVAEIEKRGLKVVGLYRLCGSAAVKKELRDAFERDSTAVTLTEELYPDINVITGILKDYLRELPSPLITRSLYEIVLEAMSMKPVSHDDTHAQRCHSTVSLLQCLPGPEKATLTLLLDHLSLVASFSDSNRMTCQNLAVCFGPVLLTPTQESWIPCMPGPATPSASASAPALGHPGRSFTHSEDIANAVDFKRHIEVLHYLLQLWPIPTDRVPDSPTLPPASSPNLFPPSPTLADTLSHNSIPRRSPCPPLRLEMPQDVVVSRRGRGRLESPPCNRYAGDWTLCGRDFLSGVEADYDEVAGSDSDNNEDNDDGLTVGCNAQAESWSPCPASGLYVDDFALDFDAPFTCRLSLKDFDTLISDLERELAKQINICL